MKLSSAITSFPKSFRIQKIQVDGATIHVRAGGKGTAVVMLTGLAIPATCGGPWRRC